MTKLKLIITLGCHMPAWRSSDITIVCWVSVPFYRKWLLWKLGSGIPVEVPPLPKLNLQISIQIWQPYEAPTYILLRAFRAFLLTYFLSAFSVYIFLAITALIFQLILHPFSLWSLFRDNRLSKMLKGKAGDQKNRTTLVANKVKQWFSNCGQKWFFL